MVKRKLVITRSDDKSSGIFIFDLLEACFGHAVEPASFELASWPPFLAFFEAKRKYLEKKRVVKQS